MFICDWFLVWWIIGYRFLWLVRSLCLCWTWSLGRRSLLFFLLWRFLRFGWNFDFSAILFEFVHFAGISDFIFSSFFFIWGLFIGTESFPLSTENFGNFSDTDTSIICDDLLTIFSDVNEVRWKISLWLSGNFFLLLLCWFLFTAIARRFSFSFLFRFLFFFLFFIFLFASFAIIALNQHGKRKETEKLEDIPIRKLTPRSSESVDLSAASESNSSSPPVFASGSASSGLKSSSVELSSESSALAMASLPIAAA